jgi:hypothetical protein
MKNFGFKNGILISLAIFLAVIALFYFKYLGLYNGECKVSTFPTTYRDCSMNEYSTRYISNIADYIFVNIFQYFKYLILLIIPPFIGYMRQKPQQ